MKDIKVNTSIWITLTAIGVYVGVKNHKRDGFWSGVVAAVFALGVVSVSVHSNKNSKQ